jgi:hypothetical protein
MGGGFMKPHHIAYTVLFFAALSAHAGSKWDGLFVLKSGDKSCAQTLSVKTSTDGQGKVSTIDLNTLSADGKETPLPGGRFDKKESAHSEATHVGVITDRKAETVSWSTTPAADQLFLPLHNHGPRVILSPDNQRLVFNTKYGSSSNNQCFYARSTGDNGQPTITAQESTPNAPADAPAMADHVDTATSGGASR